jgi:hypothetical protein
MADPAQATEPEEMDPYSECGDEMPTDPEAKARWNEWRIRRLDDERAFRQWGVIRTRSLATGEITHEAPPPWEGDRKPGTIMRPDDFGGAAEGSWWLGVQEAAAQRVKALLEQGDVAGAWAHVQAFQALAAAAMPEGVAHPWTVQGFVQRLLRGQA